MVNKKIGVYGLEGISKKIAEMNLQKERLIVERDKLNKQISVLNSEINKWSSGEISPNQTFIEF
jgi:hypothetical protein